MAFARRGLFWALLSGITWGVVGATLDSYEGVLLLRLDIFSDEASSRQPSFRLAALARQLEGELAQEGCYRALALAGGRPCGLDEACAKPAACTVLDLVRPSPLGCGIDVIATGERAGWSPMVRGDVDSLYGIHALVLVG